MQKLKDYGYIKTEQIHKNGRLSHNVYSLMEEIPGQYELQCRKKQDTEIQLRFGISTGNHTMYIASTLSDDEKIVTIMQLLLSYYCDKNKCVKSSAAQKVCCIDFEDLEKSYIRKFAMGLFEIAKQNKYRTPLSINILSP